jgi:hypothetical protein
MRSHEALQYLPPRGLPPTLEVECASAHCGKRMMLAHAVAFPALIDGSVLMAFFCSERCYLEEIPRHCCCQA